ncbi:LEM domain-containing protein 1 [Trichinella patagoniensis]|uniref:LEM domain-containing protein 1 n=1 Tax=Trichinella patagoniensis TaxID=990121 RepID=A0A0V0ZRZ6_9BILA|nr:LEM domain-containing protein 1 [Trichinella patagoniensis]
MAKKSVNLKDDDEIYRELRELGLKFGPITDSTRSLYLKKLDAALTAFAATYNVDKAAAELPKRGIGARVDKSTEQLNKDNQLEGSETVRKLEDYPFKYAPFYPYSAPERRSTHGMIKRRIPIVRNREPELEQNKKSGWNINIGMLALFAVFFVVFIYMLIYRVKNDT